MSEVFGEGYFLSQELPLNIPERVWSITLSCSGLELILAG